MIRSAGLLFLEVGVTEIDSGIVVGALVGPIRVCSQCRLPSEDFTGRRLQGGEVWVFDPLHSPVSALLLDCLHLIKRNRCVLGVADLAVELREQVVDGACFVA